MRFRQGAPRAPHDPWVFRSSSAAAIKYVIPIESRNT